MATISLGELNAKIDTNISSINNHNGKGGSVHPNATTSTTSKIQMSYPNFVSSNIRSGVFIFGVTGEMSSGGVNKEYKFYSEGNIHNLGTVEINSNGKVRASKAEFISDTLQNIVTPSSSVIFSKPLNSEYTIILEGSILHVIRHNNNVPTLTSYTGYSVDYTIGGLSNSIFKSADAAMINNNTFILAGFYESSSGSSCYYTYYICTINNDGSDTKSDFQILEAETRGKSYNTTTVIPLTYSRFAVLYASGQDRNGIVFIGQVNNSTSGSFVSKTNVSLIASSGSAKSDYTPVHWVLLNNNQYLFITECDLSGNRIIGTVMTINPVNATVVVNHYAKLDTSDFIHERVTYALRLLGGGKVIIQGVATLTGISLIPFKEYYFDVSTGTLTTNRIANGCIDVSVSTNELLIDKNIAHLYYK